MATGTCSVCFAPLQLRSSDITGTARTGLKLAIEGFPYQACADDHVRSYLRADFGVALGEALAAQTPRPDRRRRLVGPSLAFCPRCQAPLAHARRLPGRLQFGLTLPDLPAMRATLELPTLLCLACSLEMAPPDPELHADILDALGSAIEGARITR